MGGGGGLGGLVSGIGGVLEDATGINLGNSSSTDKALRAQQRATDSANATQRYMFDMQREDQKPWQEAGRTALGQLADGDFQRDFTMNDFQQDPGYQFRMAEGAKALERSAAARGGLMGGATMKALTQYGQNFASNEYTNAYNRFNADRDRRFNRLSSIAGIGQTANAQMGQTGQNYANQYGQNMTNMANAQGAAAMNQANRLNGLIGQGIHGAAQGAMMSSDERVKKNIEPISKADIKELRETLKPYQYQYIDDTYGKGNWIGAMAQDLMKSKVGRTLVRKNKDGVLMVDTSKVAGLFLAAMAEG